MYFLPFPFNQFNFLLDLVLKASYEMSHVDICNVSVFGNRNRIASAVANVWTLYGQEPHSAAGTSEWWHGETFNLLESD